MAGQQGGVSVFHFTSRISSAKIKKYKLATERGMDQGPQQPRRSNGGGPVVTPAPQVPPASTLNHPAQSPAPYAKPPSETFRVAETLTNPLIHTHRYPMSASPAGEPSSKKPRLTIHPPRGSPAEDSITVARPQTFVHIRRNSHLRIRYDENMVLDDPSLREHSPDTSDLSELEETPPPPRPRNPPQAKRPSNPEYGDFMSYYVEGADQDEPKATAAVKSSSRAPAVARNRSSNAQHGQGQTLTHGQAQQHRNSSYRYPQPGQPQYIPAARQPPPPPPPPIPQIMLVDEDPIPPNTSNEPQTVEEMVKKLQALSHALTNFGGVPGVPGAPRPEDASKKDAGKTPEKKQAKTKKADKIDNFLGMFEDESSDDEAADGKTATDDVVMVDAIKDLNFKLEKPGELDDALNYGIQFIQNALKSWAQQKLQAQLADTLRSQGVQWAQQNHHQQKRGPGRPRKFPGGEEMDHSPQSAQPPPIRINMNVTAEGLATKAFQAVLNSGCLQVNTVLPTELTSALRHLYKQIDHLINQGPRHEPHWQPMSYGAQIAANKMRVEKWLEVHTKAQEDAARQQQLAQQQAMQQMGLPAHAAQISPTQAAQQAEHQRDVDLERRRNAQHAMQQPHLSQHHLNPLKFGSQPGTPVSMAPSQSPMNAQQSASPAPNSAKRKASTPSRQSSQSTQVNGQQHMEKVKLYVPGYMPRSGAQMKFSFAPSNDQAVKVFGAQAFANSQDTNVSPTTQTAAQTVTSPGGAVNGAAGSPMVVDSIERSGHAHQPHGEPMEGVEQAASSPVKKEKTQTPGPVQATGFTAVNGPQRAVSSSAGSPTAAAEPAVTVQSLGSGSATLSKMKGQGQGAEMASRFPHPGAVVVDQ